MMGLTLGCAVYSPLLWIQLCQKDVELEQGTNLVKFDVAGAFRTVLSIPTTATY